MQTQIPGQWTALVEVIKELPGVQAANLWTRVPGKERIYARNYCLAAPDSGVLVLSGRL